MVSTLTAGRLPTGVPSHHTKTHTHTLILSLPPPLEVVIHLGDTQKPAPVTATLDIHGSMGDLPPEHMLVVTLEGQRVGA